jgi:hypothetical protein
MEQVSTADQTTVDQTIADQIAEKLGPYLGVHNAKNAVKTFSRSVFGRGPDTLTIEDLPALLDGLRPMLRTLVGEDSAESVLRAIEREVKA